MPTYLCPKNLRISIIIVLISGCAFLGFSRAETEPLSGNKGYIQENQVSETKKGTVLIRENPQSDLKVNTENLDKLSELQRTARNYREQGLKLQASGDLVTALAFYQKAVELDPSYAAVYNDAGVIYEASGDIPRAEEAYLRALKIDSNFLSSYTNLALLYENKRDIEKAAYYWQRRSALGDPADPWTIKAKQRFDDINLVTQDRPLQDQREQEMTALIDQVAAQKELVKKDDAALAAVKFAQAKEAYDKGDYAAARKFALDAQYMDPSNRKIEEFIDQAQRRALER